jgi:hypothetical protein
MPLINTSVPNLIQGVSQQPDATRHAGQCEEQENALSSVVDGLKKRPNTRHVARLLTTAIDEDSFVHFINRDDNEKYVVIHNGTNIRAWNILTGNEASIKVGDTFYKSSWTSAELAENDNRSASPYQPPTSNYLETVNPRGALKAITLSDRTLILNKSKTVEPLTTKTPQLEKTGLVTILQGDYKKDYRVDVEVVPDGSNTTAPVNLVMPTFSFTMEMYLYETKAFSSGRTGRRYEYYYRHRVANVSITNAGSGISGVINFNFSSDRAIYTYPNITATIANGQVTAVNIGNAGSFAGSGYFNQSQGGTNTIADTYYGQTPPNVSLSVTGGYIASTGNLFAIETSGDSTINNVSAPQSANTSNIANGLKNQMVDTSGSTNGGGFSSYFSVLRNNGDSNIYLTLTTGNSDFTLSTSDDLANGGMRGIYKEVDSISSLPSRNKNGFRVKVKGDPELSEDDYYVVFETNQGQVYGEGTYVETVGFDIVKGYKPETMPVSLVNYGVDSFELKETIFQDRVSGDDESNPLPSFVGSNIDDIFLYKNRLGFLSEDNIIMSEAGFGVLNDNSEVVYNFGRNSVTSLLDSDPIDISVSSSRVTKLKSAKGFQENLVMFADSGQFVLKGGDLLTPKTVSVTPITNFGVETQVDPLPLGSYIYFPFTRGAFTGLREFTINASTDVYDSVEVTEHVPAYIPHNIIDMAGTTSEDTIALLSGDETDALYIYHYFWNNNQKVLSSWSKFTFDDDIRGIEFIDSTLYMVTVDDHGNTHLLALPMEADAAEVDYNGNAAPFRTLVDKRVRAKIDIGNAAVAFEQSDGTYSSANADLPYTYYNGNIPSGGATLPEVFVDSDGNEYALKYQNIGSGGQVLLSSGAATSTSYGYVGLPYTMKYKFSTQVFKASSGNSASPTAASSMQVRNGVLFFDDTHTFDVKVTPDGRSEVTETFSADDRPEAETLGNRKFAEGNFRFPVHSKAKNVEIVVENDSPFDSKFSSAEFESFVHPRSRRYG